jgi:hypothetical protein
MKKRIIVSFIAFFVIFSSMQMSVFAMGGNGSTVPGYVDPLDILKQLPGQADGYHPQLPNPLQNAVPSLPSGLNPGQPAAPGAGSSGGTSTQSAAGPESEDPMNHPVDLATGQLKLKSADIRLPGIGFGFDLERTYDSSVSEQGAFGIGWDYNWNSLLRMYADYALGEFRWDETVNTYSFVKDDSEGYILEYDGDDKVNYELHKGHYEFVDGEKVARIGEHE